MKRKRWTKEEIFVEVWAWILVLAFAGLVIYLWN